jgi:protein SCO1
VSLSQFRGKPVVLTFLYTHCPDVCPLIAEQLHRVMLDLGQEAQCVGVLAISVEPTRDTVAAALAFSKAHSMTTFWHFLVGTQAQLAPVWTAYAIGARAVYQPPSVCTPLRCMSSTNKGGNAPCWIRILLRPS